MEHLDKALAREAYRLNKNVLDPVVVRNADDIRRLLAELDPAKDPKSNVVKIHGQLDVKDDSGFKTYAVTADTKSKSKREYLLEGLKMIAKRQESKSTEPTEPTLVNGVEVYPAKLGNSVDGYTWVDGLLKQWLGASRDGVNIYWDLSDGYRYKYNIFEHKLTRSIQQNAAASAGDV